jgi:hypothetical protein
MAFFEYADGVKVQGQVNGAPATQQWRFTDANLIATRMNELRAFVQTMQDIIEAPEATIMLRPAGTGPGEGDMEAGTDAQVFEIIQEQVQEAIPVALSDLTSDLAANGQAAYFRAPYNLKLVSVSASVIEAPTGSAVEVQIYDDGVGILSTTLTIDAGEKTSSTAATPAVIGTASVVADSEIVFEIVNVGSTTAGKGLVVNLVFHREV